MPVRAPVDANCRSTRPLCRGSAAPDVERVRDLGPRELAGVGRGAILVLAERRPALALVAIGLDPETHHFVVVEVAGDAAGECSGDAFAGNLVALVLAGDTALTDACREDEKSQCSESGRDDAEESLGLVHVFLLKRRY